MTVITDEAGLDTCYEKPSDLALRKQLDHLDRHAKHFISLSPFVVIASSGADGADCSPRGDAPGFVTVADDRTLLLPDRRGNNRLDTLRNLTRHPEVGLLFFVPGVNETLRVNGTAEIVTDPALLQTMAVKGQAPKSALRVAVRQMYFHCGKALLRSDLWNPEKKLPRGQFPTLGRIAADQVAGLDAAKTDAYLEESYKSRLY